MTSRPQHKVAPRVRYSAATVLVPARLHFGFLDLNGNLGRRFGSFGLTLDGIHTRLRAEPDDRISASGPSARRAEDFARRIGHRAGLAEGVRITVEEAIPEHAGLGSGTQLGLAVGAAFLRLYGLEPSAREIAGMLERGTRSGLGIGAFEQGGVLLDGGRRDGRDGDSGPPAPIVSRIDFPASWRILLILDRHAQGLHGEAEKKAFRELPPFPAELSAHLCRRILMVGLPAVAEGDLPGFAHAVTALQDAIGDHFAFAQGGRYASAAVADVLAWLRANGIEGVGQSSWGPTGFALVDGEAAGRALLETVRAKWADDDGLRFMLCRGRNQGHRIETGCPVRAEARELRY